MTARDKTRLLRDRNSALVQTRVRPAVAEWLARKARDAGISVAALLRGMVIREYKEKR